MHCVRHRGVSATTMMGNMAERVVAEALHRVDHKTDVFLAEAISC